MFAPIIARSPLLTLGQIGSAKAKLGLNDAQARALVENAPSIQAGLAALGLAVPPPPPVGWSDASVWDDAAVWSDAA